MSTQPHERQPGWTYITCPDCDGKKGGDALVCGPGVSGMRWMPCGFCKGAGEVTTYQGIQYRLGRRLRELRMEKGYTVREAAKAYGVGFLVWNDLEHGRSKNLVEIDDARLWLERQPKHGEQS